MNSTAAIGSRFTLHGSLCYRTVVKHSALIVAVLALATVLRGWAIDWGAPYLYHPDEHLVLHPAVNMVREGDLNPHWFQYPSLLIYLQAGVVAGLQPIIHAPLTTDPAVNRTGPWDALPAQWPFALGGRLMVVTFAVLGAWLLYRAGAVYSAAPAGVAAALFLVSSQLHNESSHYLTTDVPAATLLTAALLFSAHAAQRHAVSSFAAAGFFAGLAAGTKYTAGVVLVVPLAVALSSSFRDTLHRGGATIVAAAAGFLVACPFALLDFPTLWSGIVQQRRNYLHGPGGPNNWRWYLHYLYTLGLGRPLAVTCAIGLGGGLVRGAGTWAQRRLSLALVVVPVVYFVLLSSYQSRTERNLIPILPFICLLGADLGWRITRRLGHGRTAAAAFALVVCLVAAPGVLSCLRYDRQLSRQDTRTVALEWIEANLPPGSRIAREEYTPQVSADRYQVTYLWSLAFRPQGWYVDEQFDYLVVSSSVYGRALYPPYVAGAAGPPFYTRVLQSLPLAAEFAPAADRPGPAIRIYRVPRA